MSYARPLTPADRKRIAQLSDQGLSSPQIAARLNMKAATVKSAVMRLNGRKRKKEAP
jgi:IS30 family transposase